jgi:ATP-dependent RNA helicase RhlE
VTFEALGLSPSILRAIREEGYTVPSPIQRDAIGPVLAGRDVLGCAQTGTGKTAAFALPILHRLDASATDEPKIRALVLAPTRELAAQIHESFVAYGRHVQLWHTVLFGGVSDKTQIRELKEGVDTLVATPGRLLDLIERGFVDLRFVETLVLDEADQMLDMGFMPDIRRILSKLPAKRQNLLFSATMPEEIRRLADGILRDPVSVTVAAVATPAEKIVQSIYFVDRGNKAKLLLNLLEDKSIMRALLFTRMKHGANRIAELLQKSGTGAAAIHGNKSQGARTRALEGFKRGELRVLVATDIAARGIDVDGITHVINYDLPNVPETYVHRIGRTARAGAEGKAISLCDVEERPYLVDIERLMRRHVDRVEAHGYPPAQSLPHLTDLAGRVGRGSPPPRGRGYSDEYGGDSGPSNGGGGSQGGRRDGRAPNRPGARPEGRPAVRAEQRPDGRAEGRPSPRRF